MDFHGDADATWLEFGYQLREGPVLTAAAGAQQVALNWTAVDTTHWSPRPALTYTVTREGDNVETVAEGITDLAFVDSGVTTGATYTYQVAAVVEGGEATRSELVTVTAVVGPALPEISITAGPSPVAEGTSATFTLARTGPTAAELPVALSMTESGAMLAGNLPVSVTFGIGDSSVTLTAATDNDAVVEADSAVTTTVTPGEGYTVGTEASASLSVEDNDAATFTVSAEPESISEGESATLTVAISNGLTFAEDQVVSLALSGTASTSDYSGVQSTLTLAAGASLATAELTASDDQEEEEAETVTITASHGGAEIGSATVTINSVSHDATLSSLSLSGIDIGAFAGGTTAYAASVPHETSSTTVTATASHGGASVSIDPGAEVALEVGANEITITVTAEDGTATQTYTVSVTRARRLLTASFDRLAPVRHAGSGSFSIRILFSEPVLALGAESFSVTNGRVENTRRVNGRSDLWEIDFAPSSDEDVHVVLAETDDCEAAGAVCTADSLRLQTHLEALVRGPLRPAVSIAALAGSVTEGTAARFNATLGEAASEALTVSVSVTESGSVLAGTPPTSVTFSQGDTSATLAVPTAGDSVVEADSTVTATLTAGTGYTVGTASSALVTVEDDDTAAFTVSAEPEAIKEGESATLTVAISNGVTFAEAQTISLATSGTASAADYTGVPATLTLAADTSSVTADLAASVDQEEEEAETVAVTASHGGAEIGSATVTINSVSHDATLSALSLSGIEIGTFTGLETAYVANVGYAVETTAVTATASHPEATVSIEPGPEVSLAVGANVITVTVTAEDGETTQAYTVTVTREGPPLTATLVDLPARHEGSGSFLFRILFSEAVTVSFSVLRNQSLAVTNGDVRKARRVDGRDDLREIVIAPRSDADVTVVLPASADCTAPAAVCTADGRPLSHRLEAVVPGPSRPEVSIAPASSPVTEGTAAAFTVTLDEAASAALTVSASVTESGLMLAGSPPQSVTVAAGATTATLSAATAGDSVVEADSTVTATLTAGTGYAVGTASSALVTVEDDDTAAFTVSAEPEAIKEGESATLTVAISNGVTFAADQAISLVTSGTASASDYSGVPATLTLAAGASSATATLAAAEDQEEEAAETVTLAASHGGAVVGSATVTIASVSHDATLSALSLSGIEIGTFSSATTSYQASVGHAVATTTVTAAATHSAATVSIEPGPEVDLAVGANEIAVRVTAEDGTTTRAYAVTVTRAEEPVVPVVSVAAVEERVTEADLARFTVSRTGPTAEALDVQVQFASTTTERVQTLTVRISAGQRSVTRRVQVGDNTIAEDDVTVTWTLAEGEGYTVSAEQSSASVVLEENDVPAFAVSVEPAEVAEGESATVTVAITNGVTFRQAETIALSVSGTASASDYTGLPATLTLRAYGTAARFSTTGTLTAAVGLAGGSGRDGHDHGLARGCGDRLGDGHDRGERGAAADGRVRGDAGNARRRDGVHVRVALQRGDRDQPRDAAGHGIRCDGRVGDAGAEASAAVEPALGDHAGAGVECGRGAGAAGDHGLRGSGGGLHGGRQETVAARRGDRQGAC